MLSVRLFLVGFDPDEPKRWVFLGVLLRLQICLTRLSVQISHGTVVLQPLETPPAGDFQLDEAEHNTECVLGHLENWRRETESKERPPTPCSSTGGRLIRRGYLGSGGGGYSRRTWKLRFVIKRRLEDNRRTRGVCLGLLYRQEISGEIQASLYMGS